MSSGSSPADGTGICCSFGTIFDKSNYSLILPIEFSSEDNFILCEFKGVLFLQIQIMSQILKNQICTYRLIFDTKLKGFGFNVYFSLVALTVFASDLAGVNSF